MTAVFKSTYLTYFSDFKRHDILRFFEMVYQPVFESTYLSFSKFKKQDFLLF